MRKKVASTAGTVEESEEVDTLYTRLCKRRLKNVCRSEPPFTEAAYLRGCPRCEIRSRLAVLKRECRWHRLVRINVAGVVWYLSDLMTSSDAAEWRDYCRLQRKEHPDASDEDLFRLWARQECLP